MAAFTSNIDITSGGTYGMNITNGMPASQVANDLNGKFANIQRYLQNGLPEVWTGDTLPDSLPNDKIIFFNHKLYYNTSVRPVVPAHLVVNEMYHSLPVNLSYSSFEQQRTATVTGVVPIDINQIVFMAIQMGYDLQITKNTQSGSILSLNYTHNLYGFSYNQNFSSEKSVHEVSDGNITQVPPFGKMGNNQVIQYNTRSISTLQTLTNINQAQFTIYGGYGQYYTNIYGEIRYRIYCITLA